MMKIPYTLLSSKSLSSTFGSIFGTQLEMVPLVERGQNHFLIENEAQGAYMRAIFRGLWCMSIFQKKAAWHVVLVSQAMGRDFQ